MSKNHPLKDLHPKPNRDRTQRILFGKVEQGNGGRFVSRELKHRSKLYIACSDVVRLMRFERTTLRVGV